MKNFSIFLVRKWWISLRFHNKNNNTREIEYSRLILFITCTMQSLICVSNKYVQVYIQHTVKDFSLRPHWKRVNFDTLNLHLTIEEWYMWQNTGTYIKKLVSFINFLSLKEYCLWIAVAKRIVGLSESFLSYKQIWTSMIVI